MDRDAAFDLADVSLPRDDGAVYVEDSIRTGSGSYHGCCSSMGSFLSLDKRRLRMHNMGVVGPVLQFSLTTKA